MAIFHRWKVIHKPIHKLLISVGSNFDGCLRKLIKIAHKLAQGYVKYLEIDI